VKRTIPLEIGGTIDVIEKRLTAGEYAYKEEDARRLHELSGYYQAPAHGSMTSPRSLNGAPGLGHAVPTPELAYTEGGRAGTHYVDYRDVAGRVEKEVRDFLSQRPAPDHTLAFTKGIDIHGIHLYLEKDADSKLCGVLMERNGMGEVLFGEVRGDQFAPYKGDVPLEAVIARVQGILDQEMDANQWSIDERAQAAVEYHPEVELSPPVPGAAPQQTEADVAPIHLDEHSLDDDYDVMGHFAVTPLDENPSWPAELDENPDWPDEVSSWPNFDPRDYEVTTEYGYEDPMLDYNTNTDDIEL